MNLKNNDININDLINHLGIKVEYYNPNPTKDTLSMDCTVRAFTKILNKDYREIYKELSEIGYKLCKNPNQILVTNEMCKRYGLKNYIDIDKNNIIPWDLNVLNFIYHNKIGKFLIGTKDHMMAYMDSIIYDHTIYNFPQILFDEVKDIYQL